MSAKLRVFIASSIDGFIAGPKDEMDWLQGPSDTEDTFTPFFEQVGALLMGRRTYDVVSQFDGAWPYGETPVLVATSSTFDAGRASVQAVHGPIEQMVATAKQAAQGRDVYLDGGTLIRSALEAGLVDDITITIIPIVLGAGVPLFAGTARRHALTLVSSRSIGGGLVELLYRPQGR